MAIEIIERRDPNPQTYRRRCPMCTSVLQFTAKDGFWFQTYQGQFLSIDCPVCKRPVTIHICEGN